MKKKRRGESPRIFTQKSNIKNTDMKKIFTTKKDKVFHPEFKWVQRIRFYVFGFHFWTEIHAFEALPQVTEPRHLADLEEMAMYIEWRNKCHLPYIENSEFDFTLNTKF